MQKLNFLTAGESHGKGLLGILEGLPANLEISEAYIAQTPSPSTKRIWTGQTHGD